MWTGKLLRQILQPGIVADHRQAIARRVGQANPAQNIRRRSIVERLGKRDPGMHRQFRGDQPPGVAGAQRRTTPAPDPAASRAPQAPAPSIGPPSIRVRRAAGRNRRGSGSSQLDLAWRRRSSCFMPVFSAQGVIRARCSRSASSRSGSGAITTEVPLSASSAKWASTVRPASMRALPSATSPSASG